MLRHSRKTIVLGLALVGVMILFDLIAKADIQHGRTCATAMTISLNTEVRGSFAGTSDRAVYRIVLERRGLLDVWTEAGNLDLWNGQLLDSSCQEVPGVGPGDSVLGDGYMRITVPQMNLKPSESVWTLDPGIYFLRFEPDPVDVFGDPFIFHTNYITHYGHDFKTAEPIAFPGSIDGALLYPEDREVFRLTLPEPGAIHAWATGPNPSEALPLINLSFQDSSSAIARQSGDGTGNGFLATVLKPGVYYLALEPRGSDVMGPFTLHVEFARQPISDNSGDRALRLP
ncbi:MAG: hypothetical protein DMG13_20475 [Acidobacteria bacterium]|nr:MAG: hypothetical protein DMG13_20475 [Acidobacteriota bacterium]